MFQYYTLFNYFPLLLWWQVVNVADTRHGRLFIMYPLCGDVLILPDGQNSSHYYSDGSRQISIYFNEKGMHAPLLYYVSRGREGWIDSSLFVYWSILVIEKNCTIITAKIITKKSTNFYVPIGAMIIYQETLWYYTSFKL